VTELRLITPILEMTTKITHFEVHGETILACLEKGYMVSQTSGFRLLPLAMVPMQCPVLYCQNPGVTDL
jgi:hypothetical protein